MTAIQQRRCLDAGLPTASTNYQRIFGMASRNRRGRNLTIFNLSSWRTHNLLIKKMQAMHLGTVSCGHQMDKVSSHSAFEVTADCLRRTLRSGGIHPASSPGFIGRGDTLQSNSNDPARTSCATYATEPESPYFPQFNPPAGQRVGSSTVSVISNRPLLTNAMTQPQRADALEPRLGAAVRTPSIAAPSPIQFTPGLLDEHAAHSLIKKMPTETLLSPHQVTRMLESAALTKTRLRMVSTTTH